MTATETTPKMQAIRLVTKADNDNEDPSSTTASEVIHLAVHPDPASDMGVILWDDITNAFDNVLQVRSGTLIQSFLKGADFEILNPLRIAAVPDVTLDVVIRDKAELLLGGEVDGSTPPNYDSTITVSGRSSETVKDDKSPPTANNNTSPTSQSEEPPRAPHKTASDAAKLVAKTMMNARLGDNKSLVALGDMYRKGQGVRQDYKAAMSQYKKAADVGYAEAQCNIGDLHYHGQGVTCNYPKAFNWYTLAAGQGYARGIYLLGILYAWGRTPFGDQSFSTAAKYYLQAAELGYAPAQCSLGELHQRGTGVKQDYTLAMKWYLKAADQGHADGQCKVGYLHHQGFGVAQDHSQAVEWYLRAAEKGHAIAQASAGVMYQHGQGVPQDEALALNWYRKAAVKGNANAQFNLGLTYEYGMGVPLNREEALKWYKEAADGGDADAKERLEELEHQGDGVESEE
ncbi:hypothetical protein BGX30_001190 [Mortierella sp. GBA39]|nr:hypothetical protein BGX30_001190 [Mortierella sp. GBA39]